MTNDVRMTKPFTGYNGFAAWAGREARLSDGLPYIPAADQRPAMLGGSIILQSLKDGLPAMARPPRPRAHEPLGLKNSRSKIIADGKSHVEAVRKRINWVLLGSILVCLLSWALIFAIISWIVG